MTKFSLKLPVASLSSSSEKCRQRSNGRRDPSDPPVFCVVIESLAMVTHDDLVTLGARFAVLFRRRKIKKMISRIITRNNNAATPPIIATNPFLPFFSAINSGFVAGICGGLGTARLPVESLSLKISNPFKIALKAAALTNNINFILYHLVIYIYGENSFIHSLDFQRKFAEIKPEKIEKPSINREQPKKAIFITSVHGPRRSVNYVRSGVSRSLISIINRYGQERRLILYIDNVIVVDRPFTEHARVVFGPQVPAPNVQPTAWTQFRFRSQRHKEKGVVVGGDGEEKIGLVESAAAAAACGGVMGRVEVEAEELLAGGDTEGICGAAAVRANKWKIMMMKERGRAKPNMAAFNSEMLIRASSDVVIVSLSSSSELFATSLKLPLSPPPFASEGKLGLSGVHGGGRPHLLSAASWSCGLHVLDQTLRRNLALQIGVHYLADVSRFYPIKDTRWRCRSLDSILISVWNSRKPWLDSGLKRLIATEVTLSSSSEKCRQRSNGRRDPSDPPVFCVLIEALTMVTHDDLVTLGASFAVLFPRRKIKKMISRIITRTNAATPPIIATNPFLPFFSGINPGWVAGICGGLGTARFPVESLSLKISKPFKIALRATALFNNIKLLLCCRVIYLYGENSLATQKHNSRPGASSSSSSMRQFAGDTQSPAAVPLLHEAAAVDVVVSTGAPWGRSSDIRNSIT
nr:hypothetical protein Iba_chr11eCG7670 [Ipomoea batatas]